MKQNIYKEEIHRNNMTDKIKENGVSQALKNYTLHVIEETSKAKDKEFKAFVEELKENVFELCSTKVIEYEKLDELSKKYQSPLTNPMLDMVSRFDEDIQSPQIEIADRSFPHKNNVSPIIRSIEDKEEGENSENANEDTPLSSKGCGKDCNCDCHIFVGGSGELCPECKNKEESEK